ncbi:hypothetical protein [Pontibacter cellulosilyticus]|uniref:Uncharacterized protein n=1 Tax=Pontibacter cellulosilyticus TaxID=1720253 RepID=A0A923NBF5_9BACT|nr:hypothetical protein [Pontibacter cellulosilyticus]MBC5993860.1 hypothetical protein [Pontibacter cellulosilyticus]
MKTLLTKLVFSAALVCAAAASASAQFVALNDHLGVPVRTKSYTDVKGSPFLFDDWVRGSVIVANGTKFEKVNLMYDQVADELVFKSEKGETKTFVDPVKEFSFKREIDNVVIGEKVFRNGFTPIDGAKPHTFYEVLVDDQTKLLKRTSKSIMEEITYSSATKVKSFETNTAYYIARDNKLTKIKNDKKSVLAALGNKQPELETFIKKNMLDLKKDEDFAKLIAYYNTL